MITGSDIAPGKRLFDLAVSLTALTLLVPLLAVIALLVKLGSPGPVLYRQQRVSRGGRLFELLKFRTMVVGADRMAPNVSATGDPRVTRVGAFLRKTYLDELPQLLNVLRGDMSLVGPRPETPEFVALYSPEERRVLTVRPGLAGPRPWPSWTRRTCWPRRPTRSPSTRPRSSTTASAPTSPTSSGGPSATTSACWPPRS